MFATTKFPVAKQSFLKLLFDANIEARMGTYMQEFSLSDLEVKVDIVTLLEPYFRSDANAAHCSRLTLKSMLHRHASPMPVILVTGDGGIQTDLWCFVMLRIPVLSVDLDYSITRKNIVSSTGGDHSMISGSYVRSLE
ncbi:hypothetical protein PInf_018089 [Phytophthora infestans]|nr:hypothetical protein PInf_018089 [Phytophthora infestans]